MTIHSKTPDAGWIEAVHSMMVDIAIQYVAAPAGRRRELAGAVIAQIALAIGDLGAFDGEAAPAHEAVNQLLIMIRDLEHGRQHPWGEPTNFGGTRAERRGDREVRLWSIIAIALSMPGRSTSKESIYRRVQEKVQAAGHRFASVKKWYTDFEKHRPVADVERVMAKVADWSTRYPDRAAAAEAFLADPDGVLPWLIEQS